MRLRRAHLDKHTVKLLYIVFHAVSGQVSAVVSVSGNLLSMETLNLHFLKEHESADFEE